jgi:hypothetical protein
MPRVLNVSNIPSEMFTEGRVKLIDRSTKWGNPFVIGLDGTRTEVLKKYEKWIQSQPELLVALPELKGYHLLCHCAPLRCHGDILLRLVDGIAGDK